MGKGHLWLVISPITMVYRWYICIIYSFHGIITHLSWISQLRFPKMMDLYILGAPPGRFPTMSGLYLDHQHPSTHQNPRDVASKTDWFSSPWGFSEPWRLVEWLVHGIYFLYIYIMLYNIYIYLTIQLTWDSTIDSFHINIYQWDHHEHHCLMISLPGTNLTAWCRRGFAPRACCCQRHRGCFRLRSGWFCCGWFPEKDQRKVYQMFPRCEKNHQQCLFRCFRCFPDSGNFLTNSLEFRLAGEIEIVRRNLLYWGGRCREWVPCGLQDLHENSLDMYPLVMSK